MALPVAVIQVAIEAGEPDENRQNILHQVAAAVGKGARVIVLPEACASDFYRGAQAFAESVPGPTTELLMRAAGNALLLVPVLEKAADGRIYSTCAAVTRDSIKVAARKTHLFRDPSGLDSFCDEELIAAGKELAVFKFDDISVGVLLGFDSDFPESFRTLALNGADLIAVCLNTVQPDAAFLASMALRNRIPLLVANRIGFKKVYPAVPEFSATIQSLIQDKDGNFMTRCRGGSRIIDASGNSAAEPAANEQRNLDAIAGLPPQATIPSAYFQQDEVLLASFKLDELRVQRLTSPFLSARRSDLYKL